jgi:hypothetical protein
MVGRLTIGSNEEVVGLGVCLVAVNLCRVVQQVVLIPRLRRVVCERPVDEILYRTIESDVVVDGVVVISRPQKWTITSIHAPRIALYAVEDLGARLKAGCPFAQFNIRRHRPSHPVMPTTSSISGALLGTSIRVTNLVSAMCG